MKGQWSNVSARVRDNVYLITVAVCYIKCLFLIIAFLIVCSLYSLRIVYFIVCGIMCAVVCLCCLV
jgi:hypothetical protein